MILTSVPLRADSLWDPKGMLDHPDVKAGMTGFGKSVFHGTTIEKFGIRVLGVLEKTSFGSDLILIEIESGPPVSQEFGVAAGMSGSPVYVTTPEGDKLIGALAYAWPFTKKPIAGVTPIRQMIETLEPHSNASESFASGTLRPRDSIRMEGNTIDRVVILPNVPSKSLPGSAGTAMLTPVATPLTVSGLSPTAFRRFQKFMEPFNIVTAASPGAPAGPIEVPPFEPGSAVGVQLIGGDIDISGIGTVTYVKDGRVLAFGHPMLMLGTTSLPMTSAYIHGILPSSMISEKMGSAITPIGTISQDRTWAIGGSIGASPSMLPTEVTIRDLSRSYVKQYRASIFRHKLLGPVLLQLALDGAMDILDSPFAESTKRVRFEIKPEGLPAIHRDNLFASGTNQSVGFMMGGGGGPTSEIAETVDLLTNNKFREVKIERISVRIDIEERQRSASIESVTLSKTRVKPGETIEANVRMRPFGADPFTQTIPLEIPSYMPTGRTQILVAGGQHAFPIRMALGLRPPPPISLEQTLRLILDREENNNLYITLAPGTPSAVEISGTKFQFLPWPLIEMLRATQPAAVRLARDEETRIIPCDFVLSGARVVTLVVESDDREKSSLSYGGYYGEGPYGPAYGGPPYGYTDFNEFADYGDYGDYGGDYGDYSYGDEESDFAAYARRVAGAQETSATWVNRWLESWAKSSGTDPRDMWRMGENARPRMLVPGLSRGTSRRGVGSFPLGFPSDFPNRNPFDYTPGDDESDESGFSEMPSKVDKPVSRPTGVWAQSTQRDFSDGKLVGTFVSSDGGVGLAPEVSWTELNTPLAPVVQASDANGNRYVGTWIEGDVLCVDATGNSKVIFRGDEAAITSIAVDAKSRVYAATTPSGKIYRIEPNGDSRTLCQLPERYIWSLGFDSSGNLFAATGINGRIYRISGDGSAKLFVQIPDRHAYAMVVDKKDTIYVGTYPRGRVYRVDPAGQVLTFFDAPQATVQSLAVDPGGSVFVGTSPRATVYRVTPDGVATPVIRTRDKHVLSLMTDRNGCVYASMGPRGKVYCISGKNIVSALLLSDEPYLMSLTETSSGRIVATTGTGSRSLAIGPSTPATGTFESSVKDCGTIARWGRIEWSADVPANASITIQTRTGNTAYPNSTWSDWSEPYVDSDQMISSPPGRYIQYRATFYRGSESGSFPGSAPTLRRISIFYFGRNRSPLLALRTPQGGEHWSKTKNITWNSFDPDNDALTQHVYYSSDNGKTWNEIPEEASDSTDAIRGAMEEESSDDNDSTPSIGNLKGEIEKALKRQFPDALGDRAIRRREDERSTSLGSANPPRQGGMSSRPFYSRPYGPYGETFTSHDRDAFRGDPLTGRPPITRKWNTSSLPDGRYLIKVVVDDTRANPVEGQSVDAISHEIVVDNTGPRVSKVAEIKEKPTQPIRVTCEDALSYIASAEFRIDDDDWAATAPVDGILDSVKEEIEIGPDRILEGEHALELRVRDSAGNETSQKIDYKWGRVSKETKRRTKPTEQSSGESEAGGSTEQAKDGQDQKEPTPQDKRNGKNGRHKKGKQPQSEKRSEKKGKNKEDESNSGS